MCRLELDLSSRGFPVVRHIKNLDLMFSFTPRKGRGLGRKEPIQVGDRGVLMYLLGDRFELTSIFLCKDLRGYPHRGKRYDYGKIHRNRQNEIVCAGNRVEVLGIKYTQDGWEVEFMYL